ncbi:MAG: hypothetical protein QM820_22825 [Minicystis sp.]
MADSEAGPRSEFGPRSEGRAKASGWRASELGDEGRGAPAAIGGRRVEEAVARQAVTVQGEVVLAGQLVGQTLVLEITILARVLGRVLVKGRGGRVIAAHAGPLSLDQLEAMAPVHGRVIGPALRRLLVLGDLGEVLLAIFRRGRGAGREEGERLIEVVVLRGDEAHLRGDERVLRLGRRHRGGVIVEEVGEHRLQHVERGGRRIVPGREDAGQLGLPVEALAPEAPGIRGPAHEAEHRLPLDAHRLRGDGEAVAIEQLQVAIVLAQDGVERLAGVEMVRAEVARGVAHELAITRLQTGLHGLDEERDGLAHADLPVQHEGAGQHVDLGLDSFDLQPIDQRERCPPVGGGAVHGAEEGGLDQPVGGIQIGSLGGVAVVEAELHRFELDREAEQRARHEERRDQHQGDALRGEPARVRHRR